MSKVNINQLDKVETLPFRCNRVCYFKTERRLGGWDYPWYDHYYHSDKNPHHLTDRIINKNIGKSFDLAFHYYCTKSKREDRKLFLEQFEDYGRGNPYYVVDEFDNIQKGWKRNKYKKDIAFLSDDYRTDKVHKDTYDSINKFEEVYEKIEEFPVMNEKLKAYHGDRRFFRNGKFLYYEYGGKNTIKPLPIYKRYKAQKEDFIYIVISGWYKEFKSKKDPEYQRLINNRRRAKKKAYRYSISQFDKKANELLLKAHNQRVKEEELNKIKIESHGFDLLTSFRK